MTVTEEELQRIVAAAVKIALKEIKGIEEQPTNPTGEKITVDKFGKEELEDAMRIMQANRGRRPRLMRHDSLIICLRTL